MCASNVTEGPSTAAQLPRGIVAIIVIAGFWLLSVDALGEERQRDSGSVPNIVFILADDLGWADLGCYGNAFLETPNIDRLASQGMRFTDAYAASPVCSPTRASIHSGQYPARFGLFDFLGGPHGFRWAKLRPPPNRPMPLEAITLAEALQDAGYVACHIGKWHTGSSPQEQGYAPPPKAGESGGALPAGFVERVAEFARGNPEKGTGPFTQSAVRFIEASRKRPFLCYLSYHAVHIPCQAREELVRKYEAKAAASQTKINPTYAAMAQAMDESVGLVLETLDLLDLADQTAVIFFSDNGGLNRTLTETAPLITTNAPLRGYKGQLYEGGIREPLIVRWPGVVEPGSVCGAPVISNDFLPTMLEIAGGRPRPGQTLDGVSLVPLLKGAKTLPRDAFYWYYPVYHHSTPAMAIREGGYKLLEFFEDGHLELYHLKDDVGEKTNLAAAMPEKAAAMQKKLHQWRDSLGLEGPTPNPDYDASKAGLRAARNRVHRVLPGVMDPAP